MATNPPSIKSNAGRNRKVTKFALAGVAVLGVGAALTSAAWTDNVLFGATAASGTIDLVGRVADGSYGPDGDWANGPINIDSTTFAGMAPKQPKNVTLEVKNGADGILTLSPPVVSARLGQFFTYPSGSPDTDDIAIGFGPYSQTLLDPGETATIVMTLTPPDWGNAAKGITGNSFSVDIQAST